MLQAIILIFAAYSLFVIVLYYRQDSLIYYPEKAMGVTPADIGLSYEDLSLRTSDGVGLSAWYVPAGNSRGVILFCHGNAGNISHRLDSIRIFNALGMDVLIFDYRGYGRSEGRPSERGTYLDAGAAWDYLLQTRGVPAERLVIFGRSLGGAVAAELALRKRPAGLIIESSFTSLPDLGKRFYPWLPVKAVSKYRYATIDKVGSITCPKLIVHSPDDEIVPYEQGRALFEMAAAPKEFLLIRGGHNDGFLMSGQTYTEGLGRFLTGCLGRPGEGWPDPEALP